jgi:hypothetical protein
MHRVQDRLLVLVCTLKTIQMDLVMFDRITCCLICLRLYRMIALFCSSFLYNHIFLDIFESVCPQGTFSGHQGLTRCSPCSEGSYQNATGAESCVTCAIGSYASSEGSWNCTLCEV